MRASHMLFQRRHAECWHTLPGQRRRLSMVWLRPCLRLLRLQAEAGWGDRRP